MEEGTTTSERHVWPITFLDGLVGMDDKGDDFLAHWENGSLATLFDKIRETMPPNGANEVTDDAKADIVAYLLQQNGYPAGIVS